MRAHELRARPGYVSQKKTARRGDRRLGHRLAAKGGQFASEATLDDAVIEARRRHQNAAPCVQLYLARHICEACVFGQRPIARDQLIGGKRPADHFLYLEHATHSKRTKRPLSAVVRGTKRLLSASSGSR